MTDQSTADLDQKHSADLDTLLNRFFKGRVVRKDLSKQLKEGANVPVYVLEYLLGMYCASDDAEVIDEGMAKVKRILAENYVRPDEAEKVKSLIRERGTFKINYNVCELGPRARAMCTRSALPIAYWSLAGRRLSPIFFII